MPTSPETSEQQTSKAVDNVVGILRQDFRIVGSHRVHAWYAWAIIGIVFGMALGIVYVANRSGKLLPTKASEGVAYACESITETEYEPIREVYPDPFSASATSAVIDSNLLRAAIADIAASNRAAAQKRKSPEPAPETVTLLVLISAPEQAALQACSEKVNEIELSGPPGQCDEGCETLHIYTPESRICTVTGSFENGKDAGIPLESVDNAGKPGYAAPTVIGDSYTFFATATAPAMTLTTHCEKRSIMTGDKATGGTGTGTGKLPDTTGGSGSYNRPPEPDWEPERDMPPQPELPASQEVESAPQTPTLKAE